MIEMIEVIADENIVCPFCGEKDFDKIGLKTHLIEFCEEYTQIEKRRTLFGGGD